MPEIYEAKTCLPNMKKRDKFKYGYVLKYEFSRTFFFSQTYILHTCCFLKYATSLKASPLQAWTGPEVSRKLSFPDFMTIGIWKWYGCQSYALVAFTPRKYSWYSFLL